MCIKRYRKLTLPLLSAAGFMLIAGLAPGEGTAIAGVYKWVDEQGQVHYGERPEGQDAEKMTIRTNETTKPREIKSDDKDADDQSEAEQAEKAPVEKYVPAYEKQRMCREAKTDIANISSRGRVREADAQGNYRYLTEQERQQRLSAARKKQAKYCR
jgi:hypothetical protein